jgi:hypothetical protein
MLDDGYEDEEDDYDIGTNGFGQNARSRPSGC